MDLEYTLYLNIIFFLAFLAVFILLFDISVSLRTLVLLQTAKAKESQEDSV